MEPLVHGVVTILLPLEIQAEEMVQIQKNAGLAHGMRRMQIPQRVEMQGILG